MKSVLNTAKDYDTIVFNDHINSIRQIKPAYKPFPKSLSTKPVAEQFTENTIHWLQLINTPYAERHSVRTSFYLQGRNLKSEEDKRLGIFYSEDYQALELPDLSKSHYLGLHSLPEYFDTMNRCSFVSTDKGHKPSKCLNAFFHGPTCADCATTLLACQYRAIETIIGTDEFDRIFGAPVSKFRISADLFGHISESPEFLTKKGETENLIHFSNPLYHLFDYLDFDKGSGSDGPSERDIRKGDILYIKGVKHYALKHVTGAAVGFNLVCTGQNSSGQNLYQGFGPGKFDEPKTYDQVKKILIDGYNKPQSPETLLVIKEGKTSYTELASDVLPYDHPIGGIVISARFNTGVWEHFLSRCDQVWHRQPLLSVTPTIEPKPVHHGSQFHTENLDADLDQFKPHSTQQELIHETALKFTHAVINNQGEALHKKPMGLFLTGSPGQGKTHLCVAVARKAADYGVNTLYIDADKAGELYQCFQGNEWDSKIGELLAGKDLVVIDDANGGYFSDQLLAKTMKHVMTENKAIMVSSNHHIPVKAACPGDIEPLTACAHNFLYLNDLQGDGYRSYWWHSPEVQAADAISQLGQYQGRNAAAVITEHAVSIDEMARVLSIPAEQIRRVGSPYLPGENLVSPDFHFSHLSKTEHQAVFMECDATRDSTRIRQFLNVIQKVHNEGLKLVVKTNDRSLLSKAVLDYLNFLQPEKEDVRTKERLEHMFPDFASVKNP
ncbi:ATP-binding protein [Endozoicomonas sp. ISHI1]|uniref:ATP-binding protein n=1 Tax=Endozoicomonas sp. ISHI1 TaxID=2825882 RepID=UPI002148E6ED|nr:ATP-binding protein [Endozoicomonas sp. ISHI1]